MISIHKTHRFACVLAGLVGALAALSAASPAALAHHPPPPRGSGGSTQAQTPIHTIVTSGGRGAPRPVPARQASPIRHVVVIYLENHTFDNVLGFWCHANPGRCPQGGMPATVTLSNGAVVTPSGDPDVVPQVDHSTGSQAAAIDGGKMDGWEHISSGCGAKTGYACVSGYQPWQVPNLSLLARDFAISDETFSMQDSPSWFGHMYAVAASTDHFTGPNPWVQAGVKGGSGWGCDSNKAAKWAPVLGGTTQLEPSCVPDPSLSLPNGGAYAPTPVSQVPTIMDRLHTAGLTWHIYGATCPTETVGPAGLETCTGADHSGYLWSICPTFAECLYTQNNGLVPASQFIQAATSGNLPAFSVVTPPTGAPSWHNGFSITTGDNWLGQLVSSVMNGPDWPSTAVFVTWDDCGCFYDQVPPGTNPDGTPQGPRVPLLIVSPYARPGYTDTQATTFAGILAYTEHTFGLAPLGVNDAQAYDFSNAFNYSQLPLKRVPMAHRPLPASARRIRVTPALANDPT